jgi:hypothetical protein
LVSLIFSKVTFLIGSIPVGTGKRLCCFFVVIG